MIRYIFILITLVGCNLRDQGTVIYVDGTPEIDSTSHYAIRFDKDGNVVDEYKSDEYLALEARRNKMFENHHLFSIKDLSNDGIAISGKSTLRGMIVGSNDNNDATMILRSEAGDMKAPIDKNGRFEFPDLPLDSYHLFVSNAIDQLTFIDKIELEKSLNYKLTIEKKVE